MNSRIRLLVVDDHPVVRQGLCSCLAQKEHLLVVGQAADGLEGVRKARQLQPDVVLMDLDMPNMNGLAATQMIRRELPRTKVLVFSMHRETASLLRIMRSGAHGYVFKAAPPEELVTAIETVQRDEAYYSPELAQAALADLLRGGSPGDKCAALSNREREVLILISTGLLNKEIASELGLGVRTVETHREHIMRKLDLHSIADLTRFAVSAGLISLPEEPHLSPARA